MLRERQDVNVDLDRKFNVVKAFGIEVIDENKKKISGEQIQSYFDNNISEIVLDAEGNVLEGVSSADLTKEELKMKTKLPLYLWTEDGKVTKYALPISGMGLWSTLYGYLALDGDLATVIGITFYKHGETPGLGAEVDRDWFQKQFIGKKIWKDGALLQFQVLKGTVEGKYPDGNDHAVDGISGATMTGNGINKFLNADLEKYEKYFTKVRRT